MNYAHTSSDSKHKIALMKKYLGKYTAFSGECKEKKEKKKMELSIGFCEISESDMLLVDGGGWKQAGAAFVGAVFIGAAPAIGVVTGIAASAATPAVGIASGVGAYATVSAAGAACLDYACN